MAAKRKTWSYTTGEKGRNRVRAFEDNRTGIILLEFYESALGSISAKRKRVCTRHRDRAEAKRQADQLAAQLSKHEPPPTQELTPQRVASSGFISTSSRAAPVSGSTSRWIIVLNCLPRRVDTRSRPGDTAARSGRPTGEKRARRSDVANRAPLANGDPALQGPVVRMLDAHGVRARRKVHFAAGEKAERLAVDAHLRLRHHQQAKGAGRGGGARRRAAR